LNFTPLNKANTQTLKDSLFFDVLT